MPAASPETGVVLMYCERLPRGRGYDVHFLPPLDGIRDRDKTRAATALNRSLERCISACPEQYIWSYKRFRLRSDGSRRAYR